MAEFHDRLKKITERNRLVKRKDGQVWPIEKRVEVVHQFLILGNLKLVAAVTGVNYDLVRKWKGQPWWAELVAEIRATQNIEMDTKLSTIVEKSLEAALDRIENGDYIYDQKSGEVRRKPAALRDIHRVAVDLLGKREFLRDRSDERRETNQVSVEEHLKILATRMGEWFEDKKKPIINLEEVEDAVYEERPTDGEVSSGLQEGAGVGTLSPSESSEGPGGTEQSSSD